MVQHEINLPEGWVLKQIKDVAPLQRGFDLPASKVVSGKYPVCYSNGIANYHNEFKAEGPGVFTGRSGTIGNVFYVKENYWPHNTSLWVTDFKGNDRKFVYYLYQQVKLDRFNAGTGVPTLNRNDVHVHKIPIPKSAVEQQKIASILSTWDKAIELKEKLIEQKKEQKKGLMQKLLTGEVRLPGFEGEWQEVKLGRIGKTYNGLTGKTAKDFGEGKPYIPYKTIFDHSKIDLQKIDYVMINKDEKQNCARNGDIFFTTSSETPNEVGMSSVLLDDVDEIYLNSFSFGYRLNDFSVLLPEFAQHYFRSNDFRKKMYILAQGSTRFNISKNEVMKIIIKIPGLREQESISKVLSESDKELRLLINEVSSLKQQKQGLMQLLLTGKVRVKV